MRTTDKYACQAREGEGVGGAAATGQCCQLGIEAGDWPGWLSKLKKFLLEASLFLIMSNTT